MTNVQAVAMTVANLRTRGVLADTHEALVQAASSLAQAVDLDPGNAALWREYRAVVNTLTEIGADDGGQADEVQLIIAALRGPAAVVDAEDEPADARRRGRKAR